MLKKKKKTAPEDTRAKEESMSLKGYKGQTIVYDWFDDKGKFIYRGHYKVKDDKDYNRVRNLMHKYPEKYKYVEEY